MSNYPAAPGIGNQCDAFYPNQPGHEPLLLRCSEQAIRRLVIQAVGTDDPRTVKRCDDCARLLEVRETFGIYEILSDEPIAPSRAPVDW